MLELDVLRLSFADPLVFEPLHDRPMFPQRQMRALVVHILALLLKNGSLEGSKGGVGRADRIQLQFLKLGVHACLCIMFLS